MLCDNVVGMDGKGEIELVEAKNHFANPGSFPMGADRGADVFWLAVVVTGMLRGVFRMPGGQPVHTVAPGQPRGAFMLLLPPGSAADVDFDAERTEAYSFFFRCPSLLYDGARRRMLLALAGGHVQRMRLEVGLGEHEVVVLRPLFEHAVHDYWNRDAPGCAVRMQLHFHGIVAHLFDIPYAREEYDVLPEKKLEKLIERAGHKVKLAELARDTNHSLRWTRERFRREFGVTPSDFKRRQTLHLASYYITRTKLPFRKIAERLGFSSANYLTYYVRRNLGETPGRLRAEAIGKGRG